ncbi:MAG: MFS transporter [Prochlorococcaceae cyanobacterium]
MSNAQAERTPRFWFSQFPASLRELSVIRLVASIGSGAVLYLTPIVFHNAAFSATQVGAGLALAALLGTVGRFLSGVMLDQGRRCSTPVLLGALCALAGDGVLFSSHEVGSYVAGQLLMGLAMGLYWPAVELAVPLSCAPVPSARGYALVRSADALGVLLGALVGAALAAAGWLRGIYSLDMAGLVLLIALLLWRPLPAAAARATDQRSPWRHWLPPLLPLLAITLLATAIPALMQSALPLDLVQGGLARSALPEAIGALLIGLQLGLLLLFQWPVGQALARRPVQLGLRISLLCYGGGCLLLALSAFSRQGALLVMLAQLPLALGAAAFLPIATEAVIELTPAEHQGLAMALFSQCFAISSLVAPLAAGRLLDGQGHGVGLWLGMGILCLSGLALVGRLKTSRAELQASQG